MRPRKLALFGGRPAFDSPLKAGECWFPGWEPYESALRDIFEREYYTNHGPLVAKLEARLEASLGVRHAIAVTNGAIGLMLAVEAMGLKGKVIVPVFPYLQAAQALRMTGLVPVLSQVDPLTLQLAPELVEPLIGAEVAAILGVNLWGDACDVRALEALASAQGIRMIFDSSDSLGCQVGGLPLGGFGALEIFSLRAGNQSCTLESGFVTTNDDALAARIRNIRCGYGVGPPVAVVRTSNGRMSEAQAAIALLQLEAFPALCARNARLRDRYRAMLATIPGMRLLEPLNVSSANHQHVVCEIDEGSFGLAAEEVAQVLSAEGVFARRFRQPAIERSLLSSRAVTADAETLAGMERLCGRFLGLPIGPAIDDGGVARIAAILAVIQEQAGAIRTALGSRP